MKAPNRSTVNNDNNSETGGERERKNNNNNNNRTYHTQAATLVANLIEHSHIQLYTGACLNDVFDCEFLMSYRSLFQIIRPAYEKGFLTKCFCFDRGYTKNAVVTGRTELSRWCFNLQDFGQAVSYTHLTLPTNAEV